MTNDDRDDREPVGLEALMSFEGRINRATFWTTWLGLGCAVTAAAVGANYLIPHRGGITGFATMVGAVVIFIVAMLCVIMSLANEAKRYHDMDLSAWWLLLNIIPGLGALVLFALGFWPGTKGANRFGEGPLKVRLNPDSH